MIREDNAMKKLKYFARQSFGLLLCLSMLLSLTAPAYAATAGYNSTFWNQDQHHADADFKVKGAATVYGAPGGSDAYSVGTMPSASYPSPSRITGIGVNAEGDYYYHLERGNYVQAWKVTPDYSIDFLPVIFDCRESSSTLDCVFDTAYKLHGYIGSRGGDVISLDSVDVSVLKSGTQVAGGSVNLDYYGQYEITPGSAVSNLVDFSQLEVGASYTLTVTAHFTNHWKPSSRNVITSESFTQSSSWDFVLQQGTVSVTASSLRVPTDTMKYGEKYTLKGTITASGGNLTRVSAYVYRASDSAYTDPVTGTYENINKASYSIKGSKLDTGCKFATLDPGDYVYVLRAEAGGQSFTLNTKSFTVVSQATYTVTYDANGGTGAPAAQTKQAGISLTLSSETPTRTGYTFLDWVDDDDVHRYPESIYSTDANLVLTANWKPIRRSVGFTGKDLSQIEQWQGVYGETITFPSGENFKHDGARFCGWAKTADKRYSGPAGVEYYPGTSFVVYESAEFYAVYQPYYFTAFFDANGGSGAPDSITISGLEKLHIPADKPVREGYIFKGWAKTPDAVKASYFPDSGYGWNSGYDWYENATLYAVWASISDNIVVQYDLQGGTSSPIEPQIKEYNVPLVLNGYASRDGYYFAGWATSPNGRAEYQFYDQYTENESITLYAVWIPEADAYNVRFYANDGSSQSAWRTQTKLPGYDLQIVSDKPSRSGYIFGGWATSSSATAAEYQSGDIYTRDEDLTLYAVWEEVVAISHLYFRYQSGVDGIKVGYEPVSKSPFPNCRNRIFDPGGNPTYVHESIYITVKNGTVAEVGWWDQWIEACTESAAGGAPDNPRVLGFYTVNDGIYTEIFPDTVVSGDLYVQPYWVSDTHTVIYDANGGVNAPHPTLKYVGSSMTIPAQTPTREGYTFLGWSASESSTEIAFRPGEYYWGDEDMKLYAVWEENDTTLPTISDVTVTDVSPTGYTVTCRVSDNTGIAEVRFPTWTLDIQDDLANPWPLGTLSNGTASFRVNVSDHNGENACTYRTHIYAYDLAGNISVYGIDTYVPGAATAVVFDANGGTGAPEAQQKQYGIALTLSAAVPQRTGFTFLGWAAVPTAAEAQYQPGGSYTEDRELTLYAVWQLTRYDSSLALPAALSEIGTEAFAGAPMQEVVVPAAVQAIGSAAFANCGNLRLVMFSSASADIAADAFPHRADLVFCAPPYGSVQSYAERYGLLFVPAA